MPEGQIGLIQFTADNENSNVDQGWGNSTNISEIILELETRQISEDDGGNGYTEESRWILRAATQTLYDKIRSIEQLSPTVPLISGGGYGVSGHFNGGSLINVSAASDFNDNGGSWQILQDQLVPEPSVKGVGCVLHNVHWICAASDWYDQTWGVDSEGGKLGITAACVTDSFIKDFSVTVETRKKANTDGKEESRFIAKAVIGMEGTDIQNIAAVSNIATGASSLLYSFPGGDEILQLRADDTFYGGVGHEDAPENTSGYWTLIRQSLSAQGQFGSKIWAMESHWVSPSVWFDSEWTKTYA